MFYFPRKTFTKATVIKQGMKAVEEKCPEDDDALEKMQEHLVKDFEWDPLRLVPAALEGMGPQPLCTMSQSSSLSPATTLATPFSLTASGGLQYLMISLLLLSDLGNMSP